MANTKKTEEKVKITFEQRLGSARFGTYLAIAAALIQALHSGYVFDKISSLGAVEAFNDVYDLTIYHSIFISLTISAAIIFFTYRKRIDIARYAMWFETYMNLAYYCLWILSGDGSADIGVTPYSWYWLWIGIPISPALPASILWFAEEANRGNVSTTKEDLDEKLNEMSKYLWSRILRKSKEDFTAFKGELTKEVKNMVDNATKKNITITMPDGKEFTVDLTKENQSISVDDEQQRELPSDDQAGGTERDSTKTTGSEGDKG